MRKQRKSILQSSLLRKFNFLFTSFILISKSDKNLEALGIFCYLELIRASVTSANFKFTVCVSKSTQAIFFKKLLHFQSSLRDPHIVS